MRVTPLSAMTLLAALFSIAMGMSIPLVFQHLEVSFAASSTAIGLVAAASGAVQVITRLPVGRFIDRAGEKGVLAGAWMVTAISGLLFAIAGSVFEVGVAYAVYSFAIGTFWVAGNTLVARIAPPGELARAMTLYMIGIGFGFMVGPPLGGLADLAGYPAALATLTVFGLAGFFGLSALEVPAPSPPAGPPVPSDEAGVFLGIAAAFFFGFLIGAADAFVPVHLALAGFSAFGIGLFFSAREGANLVTRIASARFARDHSAALFLAAGTLVEAAGLVLFPRASSTAALGVAALLTGFGIGLMGPSSLTLTARGTRRGTTGAAMGKYGSALGAGALVGPAMMGPVGDAFGLARVFEGTALVGLALAVLSLRYAWRQRTKR